MTDHDPYHEPGGQRPPSSEPPPGWGQQIPPASWAPSPSPFEQPGGQPNTWNQQADSPYGPGSNPYGPGSNPYGPGGQQAPFAQPQPYGGYPSYGAYQTYSRSSQAVLALILSIAGFFCCFILSIVGIVVAKSDLNAIDRGETDPAQRGTAQAAFIVGIIVVALNVVGLGLYALSAVFLVAGSAS